MKENAFSITRAPEEQKAQGEQKRPTPTELWPAWQFSLG